MGWLLSVDPELVGGPLFMTKSEGFLAEPFLISDASESELCKLSLTFLAFGGLMLKSLILKALIKAGLSISVFFYAI